MHKVRLPRTSVALTAVLVAVICAGIATANHRADAIRGAFFGAAVADALCLSSHHEYDTQAIEDFYGMMDYITGPGEEGRGPAAAAGGSWDGPRLHHGNGLGDAKRGGEFTNHGDFNVLVLEHLADTATAPTTIDRAQLAPRWREAMRTAWRSHIPDHVAAAVDRYDADPAALDDHGQHAADDGIALRAVAALGYFDSEGDVEHAFVEAARLTHHKDSKTVDVAAFFAKAGFRIVNVERDPVHVLLEVGGLLHADKGGMGKHRPTPPWIRAVVEAVDAVVGRIHHDGRRAIDAVAPGRFENDTHWLGEIGNKLGVSLRELQSDHAVGSLAAACFFILRYPREPLSAFVRNAAFGGDSAGRAVAIGMVLGGAHGMARHMPAGWREALGGEWERLDRLLDQLPELQEHAAGPQAGEL